MELKDQREGSEQAVAWRRMSRSVSAKAPGKIHGEPRSESGTPGQGIRSANASRRKGRGFVPVRELDTTPSGVSSNPPKALCLRLQEPGSSFRKLECLK